ncbi:MAG: DNA alkylation repair protein [Deltaproteobacteria bacterium]|nr:DNA alkylation repair protein [Deltaproteobacteria bacterium]
MAINEIRTELKKLGNKERAQASQRYFKTGPGEYGEGDIFLGIKVPDLRKLAKAYQDIPLPDVRQLLKSSVHEERLFSLFVLVQAYAKGNESVKRRIYKLYLKHTRFVNNWDLVDTSAGHIVGHFLVNRSKEPLYGLAQSPVLWERRIAIMATSYFVNRHEFAETLKISKMLLSDAEDLIHKAVGWMLREVGKRDLQTEEGFLKRYYKKMPRTMLRYAIRENMKICKTEEDK